MFVTRRTARSQKNPLTFQRLLTASDAPHTHTPSTLCCCSAIYEPRIPTINDNRRRPPRGRATTPPLQRGAPRATVREGPSNGDLSVPSIRSRPPSLDCVASSCGEATTTRRASPVRARAAWSTGRRPFPPYLRCAACGRRPQLCGLSNISTFVALAWRDGRTHGHRRGECHGDRDARRAVTHT